MRTPAIVNTQDAETTAWQHFAVVTNMREWKVENLLRWHREKAGTIEHVFLEIKGELAGGTMPTGKFGGNAAWWRLYVRFRDERLQASKH